MIHTFRLPASFTRLVDAQRSLIADFGDAGLPFALDGNLIGDVGEALAIRHFGLKLCDQRRPGIDGNINGKSVQVKTSFSQRGGAFRWVCKPANMLLVFCINRQDQSDQWLASLIYNGPQELVFKEHFNNERFKWQRSIPRHRLVEYNAKVLDAERLPVVKVM